MKYTNEIIIELPIARVIELFDNADNMSKWMPGLISFEHLSGSPGQVGAKSKLVFKMNNRNVEMMETITVRNLPDEFSGIYEMNGVWNLQINKFVPLSDHRTKWMVETEFKFKGFMKFLAPLMKSGFKNQSMKYLQYFKTFAEQEG